MSNTISFLRRRRLKRTSRDRGISLIEITIGIAILALVLGITIFTVTERATATRMETYAGQAVAALQSQIAARRASGASAEIQESTLVSLYSGLFTDFDDFTSIAAAGAAVCKAANGADGVTFTGGSALSDDDAELFRAALGQAVVGTFDCDEFTDAINDGAGSAATDFSCSGATWTSTAADVARRSDNDVTLCLGTT